MNSKSFAWVFVASLSLVDCESASEVTIPAFPDGGLVRTGTPVARDRLMRFEGMFGVGNGQRIFGETVAVRTSPGTVSVLTDKNAGFAVLESACLPDGRVVVEGYWQYPTRTEAGLVRVFVEDAALVTYLCGTEEAPPTLPALTLKGHYGEGNEFPRNPLDFTFSRELKPWRGRFFTVAHHGACENTDHCGTAPNSLESIRLAERIGSNAAELDVRITRDNIPVLFHDPGLSRTLVRGVFCNGQLAELSLAELTAACELRYGELIPTVEETLDMMVNETEMEGVYLDMKVAGAVLPTARLASRLMTSLRERNENDDPTDDRQFGALIAITTDEVLEAWHDAKKKLAEEGLEIPRCLLEYDPDLVISEGCVAWGPTWTAGPQVENVKKVRAAGAGTIYWTINQSDFIDAFLTQAHPDGIITARAALVFHHYQTLGTPPPIRGTAE
ncbi:MAG TPA: glycerophosphodiester phosphodiesterase [Polyangiaceae bacterium]